MPDLLPWQERDIARQTEAEARRARMREEQVARRAAQQSRPASSSQGNGAFSKFYDTPLYQFPLAEGLDAVRGSYAGSGTFYSGAAMKGIEKYASDYASGALRDWIAGLGNQQAIGFNAASGMTGANQNYQSSLTAANQNYAGAMGAAYSQYGNAVSQGALNNGQIIANGAINHANNNGQMWNGIAGALGGAAGYFAYPQMGGMPTSGWGTPGLY